MPSTSLASVRASFERMRARPWGRAGLLAAPVVAMVALFTVTGFRGVDFGFHWDETDWQIKPVREMVASGILLPRAAIYPTFGKWLTFLPALPAGAKAALAKGADPRKVQAAMTAAIDEPTYLLKVRRLYVLVSAFAIVWIYAAVLALRRPPWEALVAAAGLGLSWEYAYHARWVATDCLAVQFASLLLFALAMFRRTGRRAWLYAAAAAAGLAAGSKYPAVVLVVPVMLAGALALPARDVRAQITRLAAVGGISFAVYLFTTPATVLDPFAFIEKLREISHNYSSGHGKYSSANTLDHLRLVFTYLSVTYFSPYRVVAVVMAAATIAGGVVWARSDRRFAAVLIGFPLAFIAFFCSKYVTCIVRNYLLVVPFLTVLAARGVAEAAARLPNLWARRALAGGLAAVALAHAVWLVSAGESIRHRDPNQQVRQAVAYVKEHAGTRFRVSPKVRENAAQQNLALPANVTDGADAQEIVFFARDEGPGEADWKPNDPWLTRAVFGPREVNFNWYSSWMGYDRVVAMTMAKAKQTELPLAR